MCNVDIRELIARKRLRHYEVAAALGISEHTLSRWLRTELSNEKKQKIKEAIESIS
jgi:DNA-binding Xre family transcriptional regulator